MGKVIAKKIRGMNLWAKVALVTMCTVLASIFMYQGWYDPGHVQSVTTVYKFAQSTGATIGGLTTNVSATCANITTANSVTTINATGESSCTSNICFSYTGSASSSAPVTLLTVIKETPYSAATTVTGQSTGSTWGLRNQGGVGTVSYQLQLGYVTGGVFTSMGYVNQTASNSDVIYTPNLSGITYTAPAGSYLAARVLLTSNTSGNESRFYRSTTKGYLAINVNEATSGPSSNADLSALAISAGTLTPAFTSTTTSYTASVDNSVTSITVTPTEADTTATTTVNGTAVNSGTASGPIALAVGNNTIDIDVTAADGTTTKTYTVVVDRAAAGSTTQTTYNIQVSSGVTVATGVTTDSSACGTNNTDPVTTLMSTSAFSCTSQRAVHAVSGAGTILESYFNTPYAADTTVTGTSFKVRLRDSSGVGGWTAGVRLFYVTSAGTKTDFTGSEVTSTVATNGDSTVTLNLSGQSATVPAGAKLGIRVRATTGTSTSKRVQWGSTADTAGTGTSGVLVVQESSAPPTDTTAPVVSSISPANGATGVAPNTSLVVTWNENIDCATVSSADIAMSGAVVGTPACVAPTNTVTYPVSGQTNGITYNYTISGVSDVAGNPMASTSGSYATVPLSSNNNLSGLVISAGALSPAFSSTTLSYTSSVANSVTTTTVTPTAQDSTATITVNGSSVASGSTSGAFSLPVGASSLTVRVTAQNGAIKDYVITVTRAASTNAYLNNLVLSGITLSPAFASGTTSYTATVANSVTSTTVTPTVQDSTATVRVNSTIVNSGTASGAIALVEGSNTISTEVTAQDGVTKRTYTVTVTRTPSAVCTTGPQTLSIAPSSMTISAGGVATYTITVSNGDTAACSSRSYTLTRGTPSNTADFVTSSPNTTFSLTGGTTRTVTYTVTANATAANGATNTVAVTASGTATTPTSVSSTTKVGTVSPLMHTSDNPAIGTAKHGTWGTGFTCATCHSTPSTNVKMIATQVQTPNGPRSVVFSRMTAPQSNYGINGVFGNDNRSYAQNASTNICEVCHRYTAYHQYSSSKVVATKNHQTANNTDCTKCHKHNSGFAADGSCESCHGNPPTTSASTLVSNPATLALGNPPANGGVHLSHTSKGMTCTLCHNHEGESGHDSNKQLKIGFIINKANWSIFSGDATTTFSSYTGNSNGASLPVSAQANTKVINAASTRNSCNVYCHGGWTGANGSINPSWGIIDGSQKACGTCHGTTAAKSPTTNAHARHAGNGTEQYSKACSECHGTLPTDTAHVNGTVAVTIASGSYSATTGIADPATANGTCSNTYCHSNGTSLTTPANNTTVAWNSTAGRLSCGSCHGNPPNYTSGKINSHIQHVTTAGYTCDYCHYKTTTTGTSIASVVRHADKFYNISANTTKTAKFTYNADHTCSSTQCHGTNLRVWGSNSASTIDTCTKCHGTQSTAPATDLQKAPATPATAAHAAHLNATGGKVVACSECHETVATSNTVGHMDGIKTIQYNGPHGLGLPELTAALTPTSCATTWCHGAGGTNAAIPQNKPTARTTPTWGTAFPTTSTFGDALGATSSNTGSGRCAQCHGYPPATSIHAGTSLAGTSNCHGCHTHLSTAGTFTDATLHINGKIDVTGGDCLGCHDATSAASTTRTAIKPQFNSQSHHVQGRAVTSADCYQCHMEASGTTGAPDSRYHVGVANSNAAINLVVWNGSSRGYVSYTANGRRSSIAKVNDHCLSCHNATNSALAPFVAGSTTDKYSPEARLSTPKAKTSILSRYSSTRVIAWSQYKYSSASGSVARFGTNNKAYVTKALSAHGNAAKNQMMNWSTARGEDSRPRDLVDYTYKGASKNRNVFCYDCHNSHGSTAAGVTSSYSSATGRYKGGLLKTTEAGKGGYAVNYTPAARTITYRNVSSLGQTAVTSTSATFNPGASICNDCHNNDTRKVNINKPWSITGTYSSAKAIVGYWSTPYFDNYTVSPAKRTVYKAGGTVNAINDRRKPMGGHYGTSVANRSAAHSGEINGLCTPCHDPHGVSNALGTAGSGATKAGKDFGVPLLKGTWVTSPYREDKADKTVVRGGGRDAANFGLKGAVPGYHIDQNTFMVTPAPSGTGAATSSGEGNQRKQAFRSFSNLSSAQTGTNMPNLSATTFAGLCLECHKQATLTNTTAPAASNWKTKERIHQSVSGWAATTGSNSGNKVHAYTCAKCHTPHVSRLPRLMVTNCLDVRHFGQVASGGSINSVASGTTTAGNIIQSTLTSTALGAGRFPGGGSRYSGTPSSAQNSGGWWFQTNGAAGTSQPSAASYGPSCHNATNAGGTTYSPTNQMWNNKTRW